MSRYRLAGYDPSLEIIVGFDPPLQTYFAQVYIPGINDEDDIFKLHIGNTPYECPDVADLHPVKAYVDLTEGFEEQLRLDKQQALPLTPHQQSMLSFLDTWNEGLRRRH